MPLELCKQVITCPGSDTPITNLSAETPDLITYSKVGFPIYVDNPLNPVTPTGKPTDPAPGPIPFSEGCVFPCYSTRSQNDADLCAAVQAFQCEWNNRTPPPLIYYNGNQSCCVPCPDGTQFCWTILAGAFASLTPGLADTFAASYACRQANLHLTCLSAIPSTATAAQPYTGTVTVTGTGPFVISVISGALPQGLTLTAIDGNNAIISGTPTTGGNFSFVISANNGIGGVAQKTYTINVTSSCVSFFESQTWTQNNSSQNGGAVFSAITGNVIELQGVVPAVPFALASPEMDVNSFVAPVVLTQALTCKVTILVNFYSGGNPAQGSFGFILEDKVTNQVYLNVSSSPGVPVSGVYTVNFPAGASINGGFGVTMFSGAAGVPGSFDVLITLGS